MSETEQIEEGLQFWRKTLTDPQVKEANINRFIAQIFAGVAQLDDSAGALATVFSEVDTHDLIGKLWKGVGKLDPESAKIVCGETCKVCYERWIDRDKIKELANYDMEKPDPAKAIQVHELFEQAVAGNRQPTVTDNGDGTAELVGMKGQCVCFFHMIYGLIEPHPNHCNCSSQCLEGFYGGLLGKPTKVECTQSVARGSDCCKFTITLPVLEESCMATVTVPSKD